MNWKELSITNSIKQTLEYYATQDTTNGHIRQLRMNDVRAYARDLFSLGYSFNEVKYYVNQITAPYNFGITTDALYKIRDEIAESKHLDTREYTSL